MNQFFFIVPPPRCIIRERSGSSVLASVPLTLTRPISPNAGRPQESAPYEKIRYEKI
jgi:hypothetical protein